MLTVSSDGWKYRAATYNNLDWARRASFLDAFIGRAALNMQDVVLDVGTGTGVVAFRVAKGVRSVIGLDASSDMLAIASQHLRAMHPKLVNVRLLLGDVRSIPLPDASVTKVTARMVFHHVTVGTETAVRECYRVLTPGGLLVVGEGIPPSREAGPWYREMFALKEERLTFFPDDLERLLVQGGFEVLETYIHREPTVSIRNWLENSGLPEPIQKTIFRMHIDAPNHVKSAYNMTLTPDGDCLVDMLFAILVGRRPA